MVDFSSLDDVPGLLMYLVADGFRVVAGGGNEEIQRLHTGIAGAFGHNIKQLSVGLGMQLVKHHAVGVETVLVANIRRKHLVDTARWLIDEPFLGIQYLHSFCQCWTHPHHVGGYIKNDGCLLTVGGTTVDLGAFLAVTAGQQKCNSGSQFGLALFLWDLDVCGIKLAIAVGLQRSENVPDDLLLPVDQFKGLSRPGALGVAKALDKADRIVSRVLVIVGTLGHETGRLVLFQLSDMRSPPSKAYKNKPPPNRFDLQKNI